SVSTVFNPKFHAQTNAFAHAPVDYSSRTRVDIRRKNAKEIPHVRELAEKSQPLYYAIDIKERAAACGAQKHFGESCHEGTRCGRLCCRCRRHRVSPPRACRESITASSALAGPELGNDH